MKKLIALLLTGVLVVSTFSGCGKSGGETKETAETTTVEESVDDASGEETEPITMDTITVWSNAAHESEVRKKQIEEFNEGEGKELGIYVDYQIYGTKYSDTIKIAAQAGEAPEIYSADSKWIVDFVDAGYIVPFEELPGSEFLIEKYKPYLMNQSQVFNGKTYTLPYSLTTFGLVINKDLFAKAGLTEADYPETWEEVRECAKKITEACNGSAYGFGLSSTLWTVTSFYTTGAGENIGHVGYDYNNKKFNYSAYNPLIEAIDEIVNDGSVIPGYENLDADAVRAQFAAGTIGIMGAASFDCAVYSDQFPATCDWEVINVPQFEKGAKRYKRVGSPVNLLVVGEKAMESPEKAAKVEKVLELFYSDESAAEMYANGIYIPVRPEAIAAAPSKPELKGFEKFADFDEIITYPPTPDTIISVEGTVFRETVMNMWMDKKLDDVPAVMADLDKRYNEALEKADQSIVDLYVFPEGVTPERTK